MTAPLGPYSRGQVDDMSTNGEGRAAFDDAAHRSPRIFAAGPKLEGHEQAG